MLPHPLEFKNTAYHEAVWAETSAGSLASLKLEQEKLEDSVNRTFL